MCRHGVLFKFGLNARKPGREVAMGWPGLGGGRPLGFCWEGAMCLRLDLLLANPAQLTLDLALDLHSPQVGSARSFLGYKGATVVGLP